MTVSRGRRPRRLPTLRHARRAADQLAEVEQVPAILVIERPLAERVGQLANLVRRGRRAQQAIERRLAQREAVVVGVQRAPEVIGHAERRILVVGEMAIRAREVVEQAAPARLARRHVRK